MTSGVALETCRRQTRRAVRTVPAGGGQGQVPGVDLPGSGGQDHHQPGPLHQVLSLRVHHQLLPGMLPCLCVLLRPSQPRLPGAGHRGGLRPKDRGEDQRGRTCQGPDRARHWAGHAIAMGTNTNPYQPAEGKYRLTRGVVEVLTERANPFSILTKSPLVLRDRHLLAEAARRADVSVSFSVGTLDPDVWKRSGTRHPPPPAEAGGCPATEGVGDLLRGPGGAPSAGHLRLAPPGGGGHESVPGRGRRLRRAHPPASAARGQGALPGVVGGGVPGPGGHLPGVVPEPILSAPPRSLPRAPGKPDQPIPEAGSCQKDPSRQGKLL